MVTTSAESTGKPPDTWEEDLKAELGVLDEVNTDHAELDEEWEAQMKKELEEDLNDK